MELAKLQVREFADLLASDAPAPGGGSTAALEGALGAALAAMVCALTMGREKYAAHQMLAEETRERAGGLQERFLDVMDRDTDAFHAVSAAYGLPRTTAEEKAARSAAIQRGLEGCTKTPLEMMELSVETLELVTGLLGKFNASAASDLGVAALSLKAAVQGAWLNVLINVGSLKDQAAANAFHQKGEALLERAVALADEAYRTVLEMM